VLAPSGNGTLDLAVTGKARPSGGPGNCLWKGLRQLRCLL